MDLLKAADELKAITHTSMLVVDAWQKWQEKVKTPDSGFPFSGEEWHALSGALNELESELERIEDNN